jgi:phosphate transport system permease protein
MALRRLLDKLFSGSAMMSIVLMAGALLIIIGPIIYRGLGAVFFTSTVEWRKLQLHEPVFDRGDPDEVAQQTRETNEARARLYKLYDEFAAGVDIQWEMDQVKAASRDYREGLYILAGEAMLEPHVADLKADAAKDVARDIRKALEETEDKQYALDKLDEAISNAEAWDTLKGDEIVKMKKLAGQWQPVWDRQKAKAQAGGDIDDDKRIDVQALMALQKAVDPERMLVIAKEYREELKIAKLSRRRKYWPEDPQARNPLLELKDLIYDLYGPRPGQPPKADNAMFRYGATRMDMAQDFRHRVLYRMTHVQAEQGDLLVEKEVPRAQDFDGELDAFFELLADDEYFAATLLPASEVYWQYFIDDWISSHYFGGVGYEILGTIALTILAMLVALPVGVMTAGYLVECTREDNWLVGQFMRGVRMCINTLAGVPSIVFGLFGLAFFLLYVWPEMGLEPKKSAMAGAFTLGIMILPVVIRASEEAIRAVPQTYKEASLSLGAGKFRTFMTVTLPAALPGVLTGTILSMSRAAGETAPLLFVAVVALREGFPSSLWGGGVRCLSYGAYDMVMGDRIASKVPHNQYGMTMTLIILVLLLNFAAIVLRGRVAKKLRG